MKQPLYRASCRDCDWSSNKDGTEGLTEQSRPLRIRKHAETHADVHRALGHTVDVVLESDEQSD